MIELLRRINIKYRIWSIMVLLVLALVISGYRLVSGLHTALMGAGLAQAKVDALVAGCVKALSVEYVILGVVLMAVSWVVISSIVKPLDETLLAIRKTSNGDRVDLTTRLEISGHDELTELSRNYNHLVEVLQVAVRQVAQANSGLSAAAETLGGVTKTAQEGMAHQQADTEQLATAMNQMVATVQEVARNANTAADSTRQADSETVKGRKVVEATMTAVESLAEELDRTRRSIEILAEDSTSIGTVLDVINGVAEQTNLLALNAAIEAARAGEQGRGFAVVADEVRTLAQRTQESTKEIQEIIERLQAGAQNAVGSMGENAEKASKTVEEAARAGDTLNAITAAVSTINEMNTQIASAAEEQASTAEEINRSVIAIRDVATSTAQGVERTRGASDELRDLAERLQSSVGKLKA